MSTKPATADAGDLRSSELLGQPRDNLYLAKWLEGNHDDMRRIYFDDWVDIVKEQKPLIEGLMKKANTDNPLSAVIPVCQKIPVGDMSRLLLLAVATEMVTRSHNGPDQRPGQ